MNILLQKKKHGSSEHDDILDKYVHFVCSQVLKLAKPAYKHVLITGDAKN